MLKPHGFMKLYDLGEHEALRSLAGASELLRGVVNPFLAALGDQQAGESQLQELKEILERPQRPSTEYLFWLDGIRDPRFLPALFECLILVLTNGAPQREFDFSAGPIAKSIQEIGGQEAVRRYDEILEETDDPRLLFLRRNRDQIEDASLNSLGEEAAAHAAESVGLPLLTG